jgi:O-antigen ligase
MISYNQDRIGWQCRINSLKAIVPEVIEKPFGVGIGRANPGARFLMQWYPGFQPTGYHNFFTILAHETSILGVILMLWILKVIFFNGYKIYANLQDSKLKYTALGILACLFGIFFLFFAGPIIDVSPANLYFWFLAGMLLKLKLIER